jgi:hypothetical protein
MSEVTTTGKEVNLGKYTAAFGLFGVICTAIALAQIFAMGDAARAQALPGYLFAVIFFMSASLGGFALTLLQHVLNGKWGLPILRIFEAAGGIRTFILMAALFIPLGIYAKELYPWADAAKVHADEVLQHRQTYLNWGFVGIRFLIYFLFWGGIAYYMRRSVKVQEVTGRYKEQQKRTNIGSASLVFIVLTVTFAYTDWVMALDPHWWSSMYGLWFVAGMGLNAVSLAAVLSCLNATKAPYNAIVNKSWTRDIGNLMFTFTMLWGYTNLGQYLIIWHGNIPETTTYLVNRSLGHWSYLSFALVIGQFFVPFFALLSPRVKATPKYLAWVGIWILAMRVLDHFHVIVPFFRPNMAVYLPDILSFLGVGGLWAAVFSYNVRRVPLLPTYDPRLLEVEHAH